MSVKKLNATDQWIVTFLEGKDWTSPTSIGKAYGTENNKEDLHSSWASPKCKKLVSFGLLERSKNGHYRLVNQEKESSCERE